MSGVNNFFHRHGPAENILLGGKLRNPKQSGKFVKMAKTRAKFSNNANISSGRHSTKAPNNVWLENWEEMIKELRNGKERMKEKIKKRNSD